MKNQVKLFLKISACCIAFGLLAFIPGDDDPFSKLVTNLQRWTDSIPQEKVYLHMDKPYYAVGDTIWFKGYLTIGPRHQLSALSGAVYVELINEKDSLLQRLKLPVTAGMVMGDFILNDDFQQGNYRIRAFTQWMRNTGPDYFFDRTFLVGDGGGSIIAQANFNYKNNNGKPELSALLNYTTESGSAIGEKDVRFEIRQKDKVFWQQNAKTDALGSLKIIIPDDVRKNPAGVYIHTIVHANAEYPAIRDFPVKFGFSQSDVQFFPESGNLVNGIPSHVAFKAVSTDGSGINIKGSITDNEQQEVAKMQTLHAGMGSFSLTPQQGKTYSAHITFDDGSTKIIPLPAAAGQGYVLSVYQPNKDSVLVRVQASAALLQSSVNLIAQTNGEIEFSSPIKIAKTITSVWLDKKSFPTGIAQFTLFNSAGEPLNERLAFIRSNDQMTLDVKTSKAAYNGKERIQIALNAKNSEGLPTFGNFSVAVIDESRVPVNENKEHTIFSSLLLTSDLKGYVEQPNYYFAQKGEEVDKALDNLMLTQGYRRFTWKQLAGTVSDKPKFAVEELGSVIFGKVTTLGHKPLANASVMLTSLKAKVTKLTTTDSMGRFKFDKLFITDSIKITVQARNGKSDKVITVMDTVPRITISPNPNWPELSTNINSSLKAYMNTVKQQDDIYEKTGQLDKMHRLREVRIRARKPVPPPYKDQGPYRIPEALSDQTYIIPPGDYPSLGMALMGQLKGVYFQALVTPQGAIANYPYTRAVPPRGYKPAFMSMNVFLDGRKLSLDEISDVLDGDKIQPEGVAKIDIVRTDKSLMMYLGGPALMIYTKRDYVWHNYNPSVVNFTPKGYNKVREFYSPRYDRPGKANNQPDLRTTVYWNPYLKTDAAGNCAFNFFNADGPGTYRVVIEGINADGELGRQVYRYTVDGASTAIGTLAPAAADKNLINITAPVDSFNKRLPLEKVYLHTDKPYYNLGDTLWFKAYVLDGVNLTASRQSGLLYVELIDDSAQVVRRVSLAVKDGVGHGQINLSPKIFKEGGYTLRAYTNWMQNFNGAYVFSQQFYMGLPSADAWLAKSTSKLQRVGNKDQLQANIKLHYANNPSRAVAYRKVEVKLYDEWHYLSKTETQTGADGSLTIIHELSNKTDSRRVRVQITSLEKDDHFKVMQVPLLVNRQQNIDVQFLPEGGNLVAGLKSVLGFKAIGEDGRGVAVLGGIYDSKDNKVASFIPLLDGMGSFEFTPQPGEQYTARISEPVAKGFALPKIQPTGIIMHIDNPEKASDIKIDISGTKSLPADSACYLIGMARGIIYYSQKVDLNKPTLTIAKNQFPSGIARFTFFKGRTPLNERAVFIDNHDGLRINIVPNKDGYLTRDSVGLDIVVKDKSGLPIQGSFSLAVTDDSQVKFDSLDNNSIAASLLLNTELKGHIESPGYYINRKDKQAWRALDNLMLTQGWTGYNWATVFSPAKPVKFEAEHEFTITGVARNIANKPVANQTVLISSQKPSFMTTTKTDSAGRYVFEHLPQIDSTSFFIQAQKANGKSLTFGSISIDNKFKPMPVLDTAHVLAMPWYVNADTTQLNYIKKQAELDEDNLRLTGHVLKEIKIKDKKKINGKFWATDKADLIFDEEDIKASETTNLYELLRQKVPGFRVLGAQLEWYRDEKVSVPIIAFNGLYAIVHTDGSPLILNIDVPDVNLTDKEFRGLMKSAILSTSPNRPHPEYNILVPETEVIEAMKEIKIPALAGLEIAYSRKYTNLLNYQGLQVGIIEILTKNELGTYRNKTPGTATYRPLPLVVPKQFYSPKYNIASNVKIPDYRSTVFWEPDITTDQNGRAKVSFYTTDVQSKYTVKVAGVDVNGGIGDASIKLSPKINSSAMSTLKNQ